MVKYIGFYVYHRSYKVLTMVPRNSRFSNLGEGILRDVFDLKSSWRGLHFEIFVRNSYLEIFI